MKFKIAFVIAAIFSSAIPVTAQEFGRNKIQYENQEWQFIQSPNFDIYFYDGGYEPAQLTAAIAESSYAHLSRLMKYRLAERIAIILYNSHHDFEETNVTYGIQEESVGGFTEFLKNRVVIPYDGSLDQFRHVIHHELTHAVGNQFFFGAGPGAILGGISRLPLNLWFVEGLAEYSSVYWSTETDEKVRDAVINNYMPPIAQLDYFPYQGGNALWYYISMRYGPGKVTEILNSVRGSRNVAGGFRKALGQDFEKFSEKWLKELKQWYWPEIAYRDTPDEFTTQLTDHVKLKNYINNAPALSPKGDLIAYLSDRDGLFDIYLMSTIDKKVFYKLVSGQRSASFEEMHWLRPGISWSADSRRIVFAAKSKNKDILYILDAHRRKIIRKLDLGLEAIYSPAWSPVSDDIAFVGIENGRTSLYTVNVETKQVTQLTDDPFTEREPSWSPDGKFLTFTSERGDYLPARGNVDLTKYKFYEFKNTDIYSLELATGKIIRHTDSPSIERYGTWYNGTDSLLFVSDRNGVFNIYLKDIKTGKERPLTNLISGANQISVSRDGDRLAFVSFYKGGYDIYLWKDPMNNIDAPDTLQLTAFRKRQMEEKLLTEAEPKETVDVAELEKNSRPFMNYVFAEGYENQRFSRPDSNRITLPTSKIRNPSGGYIKRAYTPKFSIDYVGAIGGFDPFLGVQGFTQFIISDLLGNHQINFMASINRSIANSDLILGYSYLPKRADFTFGAYHEVNFFQTSVNIGGVRFPSIARYRNYGTAALIRYPINRFRRVDLAASWVNIRQDNMTYDIRGSTTSALLLNVSHTTDNTIWAYTGPFAGRRTYFSITYSPFLADNYLSFTRIKGDFRQYWKLNREYNFSFRLAGGVSLGSDPPRFLLGGLTNWLNYKFARDIDFEIVRDLYFSEWVGPLRGADYYEQIGTSYFLMNMEMKFPLIQYLVTRFPIPLGFFNVRGAGFLDIGAAWDGSDFRLGGVDEQGRWALIDPVVGFGWGLRTPFLIGLLRIDEAWRTDLTGISKPKWYISFGVDF